MNGNGIGLPLKIRKTGTPCTAPSVLTPPTISGSLQVGDILTVSGGTFSGTTPFTYSYQWKRGATPVGTNSTTYQIVSDDLGQNITCEKTATNACGNATGVSNTLVPEYNPLAAAYFARVIANGGAALSASLKILLNDFFIDAQSGGYLPTLRLHLYANQHEIAACTNLISNSFTASLVSSPTFTQYNNIQGNGSTSYIDTGYNPANGVLDDASYGFCQKNNVTLGVTVHGAYRSASNQLNMIYPNYGGSILGNINGYPSTPTIKTGITTEVGQSTIVRISAAQIQGGKNGVWGAAVNEASSTLQTDNLYECAINLSGSPELRSNAQMQYSFNSTGWTESKDLALYNRMQTLLTDIAAL